MTWNSAPIPTVRGRLARYLGQLRHNLDAVGEQVRVSVANAVGRTVAEVVGDAVYDVLVPHVDSSLPSPRSGRRSTEQSSLHRRDYGEPAWEQGADAALWRDPYMDDDEDDAPHYLREEK